MLANTYRFVVNGSFDDGSTLSGAFFIDFDNNTATAAITARGVDLGPSAGLYVFGDGTYNVDSTVGSFNKTSFGGRFAGRTPDTFLVGDVSESTGSGGSGAAITSQQLVSSSITSTFSYFSTRTGTQFNVDGSHGSQSLIGSATFGNAISTIQPAGNGELVVDLRDGMVTRGGQLDATLQNIQVVQLGTTPAVVLGLTTGTDLIYGNQPYFEPAGLSFYGQGATDVIQGGGGPNAIVGGSGNEIFYGNGGADTMLGGSGSNFMKAYSGVSGSETFYGNGGADYVYGGGNTTTLVGGAGYEQLVGAVDNFGNNVLYGGTGTDVFYGGIGGFDLFYEGSGKDTFAGNGGFDLIYGGSGESAVYAGSGTTVVTTGTGNQYVHAGDGKLFQGSGQLFFNDTTAGLHAGRFDQIDNFSGSGGVDFYLPTAVQGATSFVAQNGGTAVVTALDGGSATLFVSDADLAAVQAHTHFTLA